MDIVVQVRLVGAGTEEPVMALQQVLALSPAGATTAESDLFVLQPGRYRVTVVAPPGPPRPPEPVTASEIVDEIARRLSGEEDQW